MNYLSVALGLVAFLLLAAVGQRVTLAFAAGVAVLVVVSALHKPAKKRR